jgi:hypothetical protein
VDASQSWIERGVDWDLELEASLELEAWVLSLHPRFTVGDVVPSQANLVETYLNLVLSTGVQLAFQFRTPN